MSYANGTTHYNLPQTVGTDKRDWFDTNEAFAAVDAALYAAATGQASDAEAITALQQTVAGQATDIAGLGTLTGQHTSQIAALNTTVNNLGTEVSDVRQDAEDMITANNEGAAATSTRAYSIGEYFIYNDVLYKATAPIAIGDTIVPNTNCVATNVDTELTQVNNDLAKSPVDVTNLFSITNPSVWWSAIYNPIARTVKLSCYGRGSFPNGSIVFTAPTDYAFDLAEGAIVGSLGSARDTNNTFAFTIAQFSTTNNTHRIAVDYSQNITAEEVSFSIEYGIN